MMAYSANISYKHAAFNVSTYRCMSAHYLDFCGLQLKQLCPVTP